MRLRETYSLYERKLKSGKTVFYYQCYDEDGKRICGHSTGQRTKTAARNYCNKLYREGLLLPQKGKIPTFEEFAKGWWEWGTCSYLKRRIGRRAITKSYADGAWSKLHNHLLPHFGKMRLDKITEHGIDKWLTSFAGRGYRNTTANGILNLMGTMLNEAVRQKLIPANPMVLVMKLKKDSKKIEILTPNEVRRLFPEGWRKVWDSYVPYVANKLAACTGMRFGEVMGFRGEFLFEDYITVCGQYTSYGYTDTKTHESRNVPISSTILRDLTELRNSNGAGFLFSENGGKTPLGRKSVYDELYSALRKIGIDENERRRRNLSFHGWRHFFNITLRLDNIVDNKARSVMGHKGRLLTEHYTHFDTAEFTKIRQVQETLLISCL